jgi:hypothetical protein
MKNLDSLPPPNVERKIQIVWVLAFCIVLLIYFVGAISRTVWHIPTSPALWCLHFFSLSTTLMLWARYDRLAHGAEMGIDQAMLIFFVWPLTFPIYALKTRGLRTGGLLLLGLGLLVVGVYAASMILAVILNNGSVPP